MDVDFTRLRYFVAVAEELHFTRAAARLQISPSPLSRQIKVLEQELGGPLFERQYHEVLLTPLGEQLLPEARAVLARADELRTVMLGARTIPAPLRIGATAYAPSDFLLAFHEACGQLRGCLAPDIVGSAAEVNAKLIAGTLDVGLIHLPTMDERLGTEVLAEYPAAFAVRADDPLAERDFVRIEELADREVLVDFARPNPQLLAWSMKSLASHGVTKLVHSVTNRDSELELANYAFVHRLPVLLSYAPDSFVGRIFSPPEFKLVKIDPSSYPPGRIALAWLSEAAVRDPRIPMAVSELSKRFALAEAA